MHTTHITIAIMNSHNNNTHTHTNHKDDNGPVAEEVPAAVAQEAVLDNHFLLTSLLLLYIYIYIWYTCI